MAKYTLFFGLAFLFILLIAAAASWVGAVDTAHKFSYVALLLLSFWLGRCLSLSGCLLLFVVFVLLIPLAVLGLEGFFVFKFTLNLQLLIVLFTFIVGFCVSLFTHGRPVASLDMPCATAPQPGHLKERFLAFPESVQQKVLGDFNLKDLLDMGTIHTFGKMVQAGEAVIAEEPENIIQQQIEAARSCLRIDISFARRR